MAMDLGDAKLTIRVDDKGFNNKMTQIGQRTDAMGKKFRTMGKVMVGVGIAIAGALAASVLSYAKAGDEVHKMALRTGFATEALSELRHVAQLSGTELGSIEKATKRMSRTIIDANRGLETYARAFRELGLDIKELRAMKPEEQFWAIAGAIGDLEDHTLKAALAQEIFGRAGTELLPMLASGSAAIAEMRQEAHDLGIVFDEEAAAKAAKLNDQMGTLKESLQGVMFALAEDLVPVITEFLEDKVIPAITRAKDWIAANEGIAKTLAVIAGVLIAGGALLLGLSLVAKAIIAINAALIVMHALMGPAGWAKLAAGIAIAGIATAGMYQLLKGPKEPIPQPTYVPSMQYGGIVPGPIGAPVPIIAHGGEPFGGVGRSFGRSLNVYIGSFMGDELSLRDLTRRMQELMREEERRTAFSGINTGYFYGGSHR